MCVIFAGGGSPPCYSCSELIVSRSCLSICPHFISEFSRQTDDDDVGSWEDLHESGQPQFVVICIGPFQPLIYVKLKKKFHYHFKKWLIVP